MTHDLLQQMADRVAIEEVLIAYGRALDEVDLDLLRRLFTDDCEVSYGPEPRLNHRGAGEVATALARMWRFEASSHHISNIVIRFDGERAATASSYVLAWHRLPVGAETIVYGQYRDVLVKEGDDWKIKVRKMLMNGANSAFRVGLHAPDRRPKPPDLDLDAITPAGNRQ